MLINLFLSFIFLLEGLGLVGGWFLSFFLVIISPFFLFLESLLKKERILFPKKITKLWLFFSLAQFISTIFSVNFALSLKVLVFNQALFLIFIYVFNHKQKTKKYLIYFLYSLSSIFILTFLFANRFKLSGLFNFSYGTNLVFSSYNYHNHLGDFLSIGLMIFFYQTIKKGKSLLYFLSILLFFPFFLISFSRSAYLSLALGILFILFFQGRKTDVNKKMLGWLMILISIFSLFIFIIKIPNYKTIYGERKIFGLRGHYFKQAILSIKDRPSFGYGPGTFSDISRKYRLKKDYRTTTSHNIFLNIFSESGGLAGIFFVYFIYLVLRGKKKDVYWYMFLGLLLNFQTDYTFQITGMIFLFFILGGLVYEEEKEFFAVNNKNFLIPLAIVFIFAQCLFFSFFFEQKNNYLTAFYFYPIERINLFYFVKNKIKKRGHRASLYRFIYEKFYGKLMNPMR